ncbi:MAG: YIP1 family protein [Candidatus Izemoplasmatales bacterium]
MKTKKLLLILVLLLNFILLSVTFSVKVEGASAYYTYTLNRKGELSETNEAYEAVEMIRRLSDGSTLSGAKDLFIDSDDYMYVADTGNKRVVILNENQEVLFSFGSETLIKPLGIFVVDDLIYVADYGLGQVNSDIGSIYIYKFDKTKTVLEEAITLDRVYQTPSSPILEKENLIYRPTKIAVDNNHTMYIVNEGTTSGVLMVNDKNRFIDYFASNSFSLNFWDRLERIIYQNNENVKMTKNIPTPVYNVSLDPKGYFYTVTQNNSENISGDNLKKINIGGVNFFDNDMYVYNDIVDSWAGHQENIYAVSSNGFLFEYDNLGNLLFAWGGKGVGNDKLGLFMSASSLAVDSNNNIYVIDDNSSRNAIHIFRETPFAAKIHEALDLYNNAKYVESIEVWEEVLRYNSMLDIAYRGIGLGYMMNEDYETALEYFTISRDQEQYSEAYWEIRNISLIDNMDKIIYLVVFIIILLNVLLYVNRRTKVFSFATDVKQKVMKYPKANQFFYMFHFLKNPADACYGVKQQKRSTMLSAWIILGLLFILYIVGLVYTGFIFNDIVIEETILVKEAFKIIIPILIFIVSNYLISSLMEGEGTFKAVFINTVGALMPILVIYPFLIIISNFITLNEAFLYNFGMFGMIIWAVILLYFNIKETHNYSVGQTFVNIFVSLIFMLVIIIILLIVYLMITQVSSFVSDLIKEVILRE